MLTSAFAYPKLFNNCKRSSGRKLPSYCKTVGLRGGRHGTGATLNSIRGYMRQQYQRAAARKELQTTFRQARITHTLDRYFRFRDN